jgi:hypothetical protein
MGTKDAIFAAACFAMKNIAFFNKNRTRKRKKAARHPHRKPAAQTRFETQTNHSFDTLAQGHVISRPDGMRTY